MSRILTVLIMLSTAIACRGPEPSAPLAKRPLEEPKDAPAAAPATSPAPAAAPEEAMAPPETEPAPRPTTFKDERRLVFRALESTAGKVVVAALQNNDPVAISVWGEEGAGQGLRFRFSGASPLRLVACEIPVGGASVLTGSLRSLSSESPVVLSLEAKRAFKNLGRYGKLGFLAARTLDPKETRSGIQTLGGPGACRLAVEVQGEEGEPIGAPVTVRASSAPQRVIGGLRCRVRGLLFGALGFDRETKRDLIVLAYQEEKLVGRSPEVARKTRGLSWEAEAFTFELDPTLPLTFLAVEPAQPDKLEEALAGPKAASALARLAPQAIARCDLSPESFSGGAYEMRCVPQRAQLFVEFVKDDGVFLGERSRRLRIKGVRVRRTTVLGRSWEPDFFDLPDCYGKLYVLGPPIDQGEGQPAAQMRYFLAQSAAVENSLTPVWDWSVELPPGASDSVSLAVFDRDEGADTRIDEALLAPGGLWSSSANANLIEVLEEAPVVVPGREMKETGARKCALRMARTGLLTPAGMVAVAYQDGPIAAISVRTQAHGDPSKSFAIDGRRPLWILFFDEGLVDREAADPKRLYAGLDATRSLVGYKELRPNVMRSGALSLDSGYGFLAAEFFDGVGERIGEAYTFTRYTLRVREVRVNELTKDDERWDFSLFDGGGLPDPWIGVSYLDEWTPGETESYALERYEEKSDTLRPTWGETRVFYAHKLSSVQLRVVDKDVEYDDPIGTGLLSEPTAGEERMVNAGQCTVFLSLEKGR